MDSTSADFRELTFNEISDVNGGISPPVILLPVVGIIVVVGYWAYCHGYKAGQKQAERDTGGGLTPPK
jgi:lactobin A/cerein 7B family class IIb bacteriocin